MPPERGFVSGKLALSVDNSPVLTLHFGSAEGAGWLGGIRTYPILDGPTAVLENPIAAITAMSWRFAFASWIVDDPEFRQAIPRHATVLRAIRSIISFPPANAPRLTARSDSLRRSLGFRSEQGLGCFPPMFAPISLRVSS